MMRVKAGKLHIGREVFEAGAVLPDSISEPFAKELESAGMVESDEPKRIAPKRSKEEDSEK